jgi:hypothetical protein
MNFNLVIFSPQNIAYTEDGQGKVKLKLTSTRRRCRKSSFRKTTEKPRKTEASSVGVLEKSKMASSPLYSLLGSTAFLLRGRQATEDGVSLRLEFSLLGAPSCPRAAYFTSMGTHGLITLNPASVSANQHRAGYPYSFSFLVHPQSSGSGVIRLYAMCSKRIFYMNLPTRAF